MLETKVTSAQDIEDDILFVEGYESFWSFCKVRGGYCGVVTYCRTGSVVDAQAGFGIKKFDDEGRLALLNKKNLQSAL